MIMANQLCDALLQHVHREVNLNLSKITSSGINSSTASREVCSVCTRGEFTVLKYTCVLTLCISSDPVMDDVFM